MTTLIRPSYQLRSYQEKICLETRQALATHKHVLVQAPCRSGKSVCMAYLVNRAIQAGKTVLVLTHRDKIHKQLAKHCNGVKIDSGSARELYIMPALCYVAMSQTLARRQVIINQFSKLGDNLAIFIDEAHRGDFNKLLDLFPDAYWIGWTATPHYKTSPFLPKYYSKLIHGPQPMELIANGDLSHIKYDEMQSDLNGLQMRGGEYTEESQNEVFGRPRMYAGLFDELANVKFRKCLVFVASIKLCDSVTEELCAHGYAAVSYHSKKMHAEFQMAKFMELHEANVMVSVASLCEGWDYPLLDLLVLYRAIGSLPLYTQSGMRVGTPHPDKRGGRILDFGGNHSRHGSLVMDRDWHALWQPPPKRITRASAGLTPSKECPQCLCLISATARSCWNCGYIWPEKEVKLAEGQLRTVVDTMEAMTGKRLSELTPEELALYANQAARKPLAARVARSREQVETGFLSAFAAAMGYKPKWVDRQEMPAERIPFMDMVVKFTEVVK